VPARRAVKPGKVERMKQMGFLVLFVTACSGYDAGGEEAAVLQWGDHELGSNEVGPNDTGASAGPEVIAVEWSHGPFGSEKRLIWSDGSVSGEEPGRQHTGLALAGDGQHQLHDVR
jgi:hypothetical protein